MQSYKGVRVLVTGHTGFKGGWLCTWLKQDGAAVGGLALAPEEDRPSLFETARIGEGMASTIGDIRCLETVQKTFDEFRPAIVFHLAAQALVRRSYRDPVVTFASNVMGTVHVLEASRQCPDVRAVVCVTTDKVYEERQWPWAYRENDRLGGKEPYSASKACAEIAAAAYAETLLPLTGLIKTATARGGNVIGGGDWSEDRIVPDIVRAIEMRTPLRLRYPGSIRPWQHVLELTHAYLHLGTRLLVGDPGATGAWNFGPEMSEEVSVDDLVRAFLAAWGEDLAVERGKGELQEAHALRLDVSKARQLLNWRPALNFSEMITLAADWYRRHSAGEDASVVLAEQISDYRQKRDAWDHSQPGLREAAASSGER